MEVYRYIRGRLINFVQYFLSNLTPTRIEQSANPAARVERYTRTILTSTQNASIWSLTAAAPSNSVFCALCTNVHDYLLTQVRLHAFL